MKNEIIWSQIAITQLQKIKEHISHDSAKNSLAIYAQIIKATKKLELFAKIGVCINIKCQFRVIIVSKYKITYCIDDKKIIIIAIYHTAKEFDIEQINRTFQINKDISR